MILKCAILQDYFYFWLLNYISMLIIIFYANFDTKTSICRDYFYSVLLPLLLKRSENLTQSNIECNPHKNYIQAVFIQPLIARLYKNKWYTVTIQIKGPTKLTQMNARVLCINQIPKRYWIIWNNNRVSDFIDYCWHFVMHDPKNSRMHHFVMCWKTL